ncbi:purine-nucleoside phosphorylase [soil metagenome]
MDAIGVDAHDVVVVLGSGTGGYVGRFPDKISVPYADIPGFPVPRGTGHSGVVHSVEMSGLRVLILAGRGHAYEGHDLATVVLPIRVAIAGGCHTVILTNAAGGITAGLEPGDLVAIADHINLASINPLVGDNDERLGPRFPDLTDVYTPDLRRVAAIVAAEQGMAMAEGVYAWWLGPNFETPAEIRMLRTLGADLVGMSTVPEAIAARHMGARVAAFSLVTNRAAGLSGQRLSAEEVMEVAGRSAPRVEGFLDAYLARPEVLALD